MVLSPGSPRFVTLVWLKSVTGTWAVIVTQSESYGPCGFSARGQASASAPRCPLLVAGTSAGRGGGGRVFLSAPRLSRGVPRTRATSAEGRFRGKACPPHLASRFVSAEGERSVSHCVYCGFLWRHANHFWPTTPKSWSLNGHCHRAVVAQ